MGEATPALPNLVIAGVTKAGTTSLHGYLGQHPEVFAARVKEVNYFSPLVHGRSLLDLESYAAHYTSARTERWRLDSSPFYFVGGAAVAQAMRQILEQPRVLISLRDPVDRLWSSYRYKKSKGYITSGTGFGDFFEQCRHHAEASTDLDPANVNFLTLRTGRYGDFLDAWDAAFGSDLMVVFAEELSTSPAGVMTAIFDWLGIDTSVAADMDPKRRNVTVQSRSLAIRHLAYRVNRAVKPLMESHPGLALRARTMYERVNGRPSQESLEPRDRARVSEYYASSNAALEQLLRRRGCSVPAWVRGWAQESDSQ